MKVAPFLCFEKFQFLLEVGIHYNKNASGIPDSFYLVDNITPTPLPISANIETIFTFNIDIHTG